VTETPIMLTGGFRTRVGMDTALAEGACDVIGIARPMLTDPTLPQKLTHGSNVIDHETLARDQEPLAGLPWYYAQIDRLGRLPEASLV
jgi:2,4-dienoyl-CoA reductase-like NADH-dependent reductase (Old Yellow Enzyme family)